MVPEHLLPALDLVLDEGPAGQLHRLRHLGAVVVAVLDVLLEPQRGGARRELGVGAGRRRAGRRRVVRVPAQIGRASCRERVLRLV